MFSKLLKTTMPVKIKKNMLVASVNSVLRFVYLLMSTYLCLHHYHWRCLQTCNFVFPVVLFCYICCRNWIKLHSYWDFSIRYEWERMERSWWQRLSWLVERPRKLSWLWAWPLCGQRYVVFCLYKYEQN